MNSFEQPTKENEESLSERIMGDGAEKLDLLEGQTPELKATLEKMTSSSISREDFFDVIDKFNGDHMKEKEGSYGAVHLRGDHGDITVKYYENGSVSISGSWLE